MRQRPVILLIAVLVIATPFAGASTEKNDALPPARATELVPPDLPPRMRQKFEQMTPEQRRKAVRGWEEYKRLSPEARRRLDLNYKTFRQMSPEQRAQAQRQFKQFESLNPDQKKKVIENWKRWQAMPAEEREKLRKKRAQTAANPAGTPAARTNDTTRATPAAAQADR